MIAFVVLTILTIFLLSHVKKSINPSLRKHYVIFSVIIVALGVTATLIYTFDNIYHDQVDMPGDAQYYYEGALSYLLTGETQTYYPNYEKFLALFLYMGNPVVARLAQLMLFLCMYALSVRALDWLNVSRNGLIYFSTFVALSGIYYGTIVVFVRDFLILFTFTLVFVALAWYYAQSGARRRAPNLKLLFLIVLATLWLHSLGSWLVYPLIAAVVGEFLASLRERKALPRRIVPASIAIAIVVAFLVYGGFYEIQRLYQINIVEARLLGAEEEMLGIERSRSLLDPFKALLGPGLIRPLFPHEYFLVWVPSHAAFYWWGTLFWYVNLIITAPILLKTPLAFMRKRGSVFIMLVFLFMVGAYTLAFGAGMGMRKRAMFHFFYTLFITSTYCTRSDTNQDKGIQNWRLPLPTLLLQLGVVLALVIATILSVERVP